MKTIKNFSIVTYGCTFNQGDSLKIERILYDNGIYKDNFLNADLCFINTCAVKLSTESKILYFIEKKTQNFPLKYFVITGCLSLIDDKIYEKILKLIGNRGIILKPREIPNLLMHLSKKFHIKKKKSTVPQKKSNIMPIIYKNSPTTIVQISEGCNKSCSYCCTTLARGKLQSFDFKHIINQIQKIISLGIKEIHLTSQDLGNYDYNGKKLMDLLKEISNLSGNFIIRLGMLNPDYLTKNFPEFLRIFEDKRFFRFLHIPIQSGSNRILKMMKRNYQIEMIEKIFRQIKKYDRNFRIGTDVIIGFPNETDIDFNETINFVSKWKPSILNISKFSVRPNTSAKLMIQLKSQIIKQRSRKMSKIFSEYSKKNNEKWKGWEGEILINEFHNNKVYPFMGRNLYYLPVLCKTGIIGEKKKIKIIGYLNHSLIGI